MGSARVASRRAKAPLPHPTSKACCDSAVGHVSTENDDSGCYGSTHPERMRPVDRNPLVSEGYQGDLSCMYDTHLLNTHQGGRKNACSGCVSIFALEELLARMLRSMSGSRSSN